MVVQMDKKVFLIILGLVAVVAIFLIIQNNGTFSITRQISENIIEYDSQSPCSDTSDCLKLTDFPKDGYCMEGTCRMKIDTSQLTAVPGGQ